MGIPLRILSDHSRFREIVRGRIKANLRKFLQKGEMIGKRGQELISIPLPTIDIPRFRFGQNGQGVGQGEGEQGAILSPGEIAPGGGEAGSDSAEHALEVDLSLDELAVILGEELCLPRIEPKGSDHLSNQRVKYTGINSTGPESLHHFRRTFRETLKREIAQGTYDPKHPRLIPVREDKRYRSWKVDESPESSAVIVYMMDVSGSMGDEQKEIVRIESFWLDTWLRSQYRGLECRYVIHDAVAREVDRETFSHTRESGGTMISSAYKLARDILAADYPSANWNIYLFHFSDGDNWSADDTRVCLETLQNDLLPIANLFCYGQVESPYGSGQFVKDLRENLGERDNLALSEIADKEAVYQSIKDFLGRGR